MEIRSYRDLIAWQKAIELVKLVYRATAGFPVEERFGLTNQMRRAAVSIPSNIAEGQARTTADFVRFLRIARGSVAELETQAVIARELSFLGMDVFEELSDALGHVGRLVSGLQASLGRRGRDEQADAGN